MYSPILPSGQSRGRADPDSALSVFGQRRDGVVRQTVVFCEDIEFAMMPARQPAIFSAGPQRACVIGEQNLHASNWQTVRYAERNKTRAIEARYAIVGTQPKIALTILRECMN